MGGGWGAFPDESSFFRIMTAALGPSVDNPGMGMDLVMDNSSSNISTFAPFSSPILNIPERHHNLNERRNVNVNKRGKIHIFPGIFELVSYNKYVLLQFENLIRYINPFKASKEIKSLCGREPKIRSQGDGSLLIEASSPEEREKLIKMTKLVGNNVKCIPHPIFNQCRGVICAPELLSIAADDIQAELEDQNVVKVVRMTKKSKDHAIPLPTLILTFQSYRMPSTIKAGWLNFKVKPCNPSPLRCFHCHIFGHSIQKCRKRLNEELSICVNCGKNSHGECEEDPKCINCGGLHPASSKNCTRYLYEKEVQAIRVIEKVSIKEARRKALERQFRPGESFSSVLNRVRTDIPQSTQPTNLNSQHNVSIPTSQQEDLTPNNPIPENPVISVASGKKDASHDNMRNKDLVQTLPHTNGVPSTSGVITKSSTSTVPHPKNAPSTMEYQ